MFDVVTYGITGVYNVFTRLDSYYHISELFLGVLFVLSGYRFILRPILGVSGIHGGFSDSVKKTRKRLEERNKQNRSKKG